MKHSRALQTQESHRPTVRLVHVTSLADADGEPRVALELPPRPGAVSRRPVLQLFASMAAALLAKREMEAPR